MVVAATNTYRVQSDPDGVIHLEDNSDSDNNDDLENGRNSTNQHHLHEPTGEYAYSYNKGHHKSTANSSSQGVVDVTHIEDPPDERDVRSFRRSDPPMDPGAPIIAIKSITSMNSGSPLLSSPEGPRDPSSPIPQSYVRRDPSIRSNPSVLSSNSQVSLVKSNSSFGACTTQQQQQQQQQQQYQEEEEQQQQQYQEEEQQQQYQEDEDEDEEDEDEDEEDDQNDENENQSFEEIHEEDPDDDQHQSQEQQQLQQQLQQQQTHDAHDGIHVEETENMEYDERFNTVSPIVPSEVPPQEKEKARESWTKANPFIEALGLSRKLVQEAATLVDKQQRWSFNDAGGSGNVHKADEEVRDQPAPNVNAKVEETKESTKEEDTNGRWIISSLMNTFECQGTGLTTEENTSSGPIGLMTCGPQAEPNPKSKVEESAQDDEDDNSVLGPKAFGDLDSLPSLDDSVLQNGGVDQGDDAVSLSSRVSRASMATEYLGNAVDDKMHDIKNEKKQDLFQEKLFDPATETSVDQEQSEEIMVANDPNVQRMVKELQETIKANGEYHVRCANLSSTLAQKYTDLKAPKKALRLQTKVVSIFSTKLGDHHRETLDAKIRLGKCQEDAENYDEAISSFYEVMVMRRALHGDNDRSASDALIMIANCLRKKGQYMQAIRELKRALKVYREALGDSHPCVASTVDEIASLYVTLGDFDKSAAILEEVVKLKAANLGMQNKQVASSLVDLATSYECSEDFDRAVKALKKAYKIYTDLDGFSCEEATSTLHRIALIYQASGDIHKAAIAYLGVLRGKKHLLGDDHLEVAETYYRLGVCLRESNQLDKALKCMKEALPILVGKGKNIHDVDMIAEVMHEMALLYKAKRQLAESAKIFKQELTVRRKIGQPDYPCIAKTLNHLGVTEYEMKMHRKALKHLLEVLTIFQERQEQGVDFAEALYNIGLVFEAVQNKERAYEAFLEAVRVFKANGYAHDHPHMEKAVSKVKRLASNK